MSHVTRRDVLKTAASAVVLSPVFGRSAFGEPLQNVAGTITPNPYGRRAMGGAPTGFSARMRANSALKPPVDFLDYCHNMGMGGAELQLPPSDPAEIAKLRARAESYNMRLIFDIGSRLPVDQAALPAFDAIVKASKDAGATGLHGALTQRRYEEFDTLDAFKQSFARNKAAVALVEPTMRKYKLPLVLENHKGWRAAEQAAWLKELGSEYVGVHFDFGNNVSLCEDPMQTLDTLLPYIKSCHIKDMGVEMYDDGFLLSEIPLGEGFLDLKGMVAKLRAKDPDMGIDLEMITRDPLKIPVFTDKYWVTFDDTFSPLPGRDLARTLEIVRRNPPKSPLPKTTGLSPDDRLKLEDDDNLRSIQWARANLQM